MNASLSIIAAINIPKPGLWSTSPNLLGGRCLLESVCPLGGKERFYCRNQINVTGK